MRHAKSEGLKLIARDGCGKIVNEPQSPSNYQSVIGTCKKNWNNPITKNKKNE